MRILLVEDEKQLSEALGAILEKNNYIVDREKVLSLKQKIFRRL